MKVRLLILIGLAAALMLLLVVYIGKMQLEDYEAKQEQAVSQQISPETVIPARGTIYDADGNEVAVSVAVETICLAPAVMKEDQKELVCRTLADLLDVDYESLCAKAAKTDSYYELVKRNVEKEDLDKVKSFIKENNIKGIDFFDDSTRFYPYDNYAASIIGFTNSDGEGLYGIEKYYNTILSGKTGKIVTQQNADGDALPFEYEQYLEADDGSGIVLTVDYDCQNILMKYLQEAVADNEASGATGIIMRIKTGEVVAMGSYPDFDLNNPRELSAEAESVIYGLAESERENAQLEALYKQWSNKAISEAYEPGSTFKTITAAMALEEGLVTTNEYFECTGSLDVADWTIHCWKKGGHGKLTFTEAVMGSCNVVFMEVGARIGTTLFYNYADNFGLLNKTGIDLPGESSGIFFAEDNFDSNASNIAVASFGQRFKITPIQLITAVSAVANGGKMMQPHIVSSYADSEGNITETIAPVVVRQVVSESTSETMCRILEKVVSEGTGRNAYVAGYRVGGKTGTSEKLDIGDYSQYTASFIGIAPCDDPEYAVLVLIDEPQGKLYQGGQIAAPVVGKIMSEILPSLGVTPVYTDDELASLQTAVPDLKGKSLSEATTKAEAAGFTVKVVGDSGIVTSQLPEKGQTIASGSEIIVYCGVAADDSENPVPSVIGLSYASAVLRLKTAGFYIYATGVIQSVTGGSIIAVEQSIESGQYAKAGSVIRVEFLDSDTGNTGE